jgi:hypothetical protein
MHWLNKKTHCAICIACHHPQDLQRMTKEMPMSVGVMIGVYESRFIDTKLPDVGCRNSRFVQRH